VNNGVGMGILIEGGTKGAAFPSATEWNKEFYDGRYATE
jgi:hypothetical protein